MRRERSGGWGQGMLELALMLPLLLLIVAAMLDVGRTLQAYVVVNHAAREAARYGSVNGVDWPGMINVAENELSRGGLDLNDAAVVATTALSGSPIQVTVNYSFTLITTIWSSTPVMLSGSAEMVVL